MEVSVTYLRNHTKKVLWAVDRDEVVYILRRGKRKGIIKPVSDKPRIKVQDRPFFNMRKTSETVNQQMDSLRGGRYRDL